MSKHSIRKRETLEVERLAQLLQRLDAAQPLLLGDEGLRLERERRVLRRELCKPPLLAPRRRAHLDARAAQLREELLERLERSRVRRDDELRRDRRRIAVVLETERLEHGRHVLPLDVLEVEAVPVDHLATAKREDLDGGPVAPYGDADHVDRAGFTPVGALLLRQVLDREEPVAIARRVLEPLLGRRVAHLPLELAHDRTRVAREEVDHALDDLAVGRLRDVVHAGRVAALDVEVEARDAGVPARLRPFARAKLEDAVEHVERLTHLLRVCVRAEVEDAAPVSLAREHHAWVVVLDRHRDVRERLVVAKADVERRPVALDEVLLQVERFDLGRRHDHLEVLDSPDEVRDRGAGVAAPRLEVRADAWPQRLRLADVEEVTLRVSEEIDARFRRQALQLGLELSHAS